MFASSYRKSFTGLVLCPVLLAGCATDQGMEQLKGAGIGTAAGAALGCAVGAVFGGGSGCAKGAAIGAAAGLVTGWGAVKIKQYQAEPVRSAQTDQRMYPMVEPVSSAQVKIRKGTSAPHMIKPGQSVMVSTDYSVTLPPTMQSTEITEHWDLMKDGKTLVDLPQQANQRTAGGWDAEAEIPIPADAEPGTYVIQHTVRAGDSYDTDESTFIVSQ
jgi:hypothetical protein